ncbi:MAG TPA: biotin--[acetyl-CoA-carboxylase] ligase [Thermoanaerobaculia bacterium]|nr:biotin--[acetyl-CoA-carboxylase] ligase [Thermoanaerobaculia bacterium]
MIAFADGALRARGWVTFENLTCLAATESSNDLAREFIDLYFEEDQLLPCTVILAREQRGARGRKGRWVAPAGRGLYFTFVRRAVPEEPLSVLPIAVARWLRDALEAEAGIPVLLKWPNDLYVGRRKLAGILTESCTQGKDTYVAVGIGLNVCGAAADLGLPGATTVEEEARRPVALAPLAQAILDHLDRELARPQWEKEAALWEKRSAHRPGDAMTVRREGTEVSGAYAGLTDDGFLRLRTPGGEEVLTSGEVTRW